MSKGCNLADLQEFGLVGNDIVYFPTFQESLNSAFIQKVYTLEEQAYCDAFADAALRYASTWAAKEAVYKAVKQKYTQALGPQRIEIKRDGIAKKPQVHIAGHPAQAHQFSLTISHDADYIWAVVVMTFNPVLAL